MSSSGWRPALHSSVFDDLRERSYLPERSSIAPARYRYSAMNLLSDEDYDRIPDDDEDLMPYYLGERRAPRAKVETDLFHPRSRGTGKLPAKETRPAPRLAEAPMETIRVVIGEEKKVYSLHKCFLTHYSVYFDKALNGPFAEGVNGEVVIDDMEPAIFNFFVDWIYTQTLSKSNVSAPKSLERGAEMIKLWIMADYLQAYSLQNHAIDMLFQSVTRLMLPSSLFTWIDEKAFRGSKLEQLIVDYFCEQLEHSGRLPGEAVNCSQELLFDVIQAYGKSVKERNLLDIHLTSKICYASKYYVSEEMPKKK